MVWSMLAVPPRAASGVMVDVLISGAARSVVQRRPSGTIDKGALVSYHAITMIASAGNWESEQLEKSLARRVKGGFGAYWVAGARPQEPPPVPPIALTGGIPDPDTLPIEELIETSNRVLRREGPDALRYGGHQGYPALREWLAEHTGRREGLQLTADNFTITNGISGALVNVSRRRRRYGELPQRCRRRFPGCGGSHPRGAGRDD
jgi:DNA-binding transcriptional MocR family regulator